MKILLIEDEELYADQVEMLIDKMGHELIGVYDSSDKVLPAIKDHTPDLILMDVHIRGDYDGIELTELILQDYEVPVIFITSMKDDLTFKRASRVGATNFIIKPFDQVQLQRAIELATAKNIKDDNHTSTEIEISDHFFARRKDQYEKVIVDEIDFIEADGQYSLVHANDKKYVLSISLTKILSKLANDDFIQTHRSYIINRKKITSINPKENTIKIGGHTIPISRRNKGDIMNALGIIIE